MIDFDPKLSPEENRARLGVRRSRGMTAPILWVGIPLVLLVAFIAGFLLYQDVRSEHRKSRESLRKSIDDLYLIQAQTDSVIRDLEKLINEGNRLAPTQEEMRHWRQTRNQTEKTIKELQDELSKIGWP